MASQDFVFKWKLLPTTCRSARVNFLSANQGWITIDRANQHKHWSPCCFHLRKKRLSFLIFLPTTREEDVNTKSISWRAPWICFAIILKDLKMKKHLKMKKDAPSWILNRKLWLHKFPLVSLAYFAISCIFSLRQHLLFSEVSALAKWIMIVFAKKSLFLHNSFLVAGCNIIVHNVLRNLCNVYLKQIF